MKSAMIKGAKAAVLMLLLPCAAMAAQPSGTKANPGGRRSASPFRRTTLPSTCATCPRPSPGRPAWASARRTAASTRRSQQAAARAGRQADRARPPARTADAWDKSPRARSLKANVAARSRVSINNPNTGVSPGDPVVEVGANHVIYAVNSGGSGTYFNVYNKSGTLVSGPTTFGSLAPAGNSCTIDRGDPLLHYDRQAGRWFMLTMDDTGLCTFVSKTSDPVSGGWWFYRYATPVLPELPALRRVERRLRLRYQRRQPGRHRDLRLRPRQHAQRRHRPSGPALQQRGQPRGLRLPDHDAVDLLRHHRCTGGPQADPRRHNDDEAHAGAGANGSQDFIELYELNIDWNTPANSSISTLPRVAITEFNSWFRDYSTFATVPQPGSTSRLDPIREVLLNQLVYRNMGTHEALVGTLATNQDPARTGTVVDSGVRWFELRRVGSGNWTLHQEGTFSPGDSSTHHLMGTIAMDKFGNIGMGYNVTKTTTPTKFATLGYTGRTAADPAGVMSLGENEVAVGAAVETSGRWGDYYQMTVDPVDDCTFWFVGMYRPSGSWQTRIADFKFPACTGGGGTTYSVSGTIATSGGTGISGVSVSNGSTSVTTNASGQYTFSGLANGSYTLTPSLSGYTFSPTSLAVTVNGANVTGQNFTGTASATTFSVSGTVTTSAGAAISGVSVSNGSTSVTTNASGQFTFSNLANGTYTLTPSLSGYTFSPATRSVTVSGANVTGQNFTGTATSGGTTLTKGVPVTGLGATTGNSLNYTMVVPAGATNLTFTISGGTGDADMYVKFGSAPTDTVYDCRPYLGGNAETCTFAAPQAGTYYVRVKAYSTFSGVSLVGDYSTGGGGSVQTYTNGTDVAIGDNTTVQSTITVSGRSGNAPTSTPVAVAIVHTYIGDLKVDLIAPDGSVYVLHNRTGGSADNINQTYTVNLSSEPLNGTWTLRVNDNAGGDTGRIDSWSITF